LVTPREEPQPRRTGALAEAASLVEEVLDRPVTCGRTRVLAVDGPAGSGKTTLADAIRAELAARRSGVVVMHMDDVYAGWTGLDDELSDRIQAQILEPLARSEPARWQRYDWHAERFDGWETFAPPDVLVLEGCGSGARAHAAYTTLLVWTEADRDTRIRRGLERDGEQVLPNWLAWMDLERAHFAANRTRARADIHLTTR
jgi:uridine kinase